MGDDPERTELDQLRARHSVGMETRQQVLDWMIGNSQLSHSVIALRAAFRVFPVPFAEDIDSSTNVRTLDAARSILFALNAVMTGNPVRPLRNIEKLVQRHKNGRMSAIPDVVLTQKDYRENYLMPSSADYAVNSAASAYRAAHLLPKAPHYSKPSSEIAIDAINGSSNPEEHFTCFSAAYSDCTNVTKENPVEIFSSNLWPSNLLGGAILSCSQKILYEVPIKNSPWSFWRNWYEGFLNGKPLDWEFQKRVALIPDDIWEDGVEAVAGAIEGIQKPFEIKEQIRELKTQLAQIEEPRIGIGHNNPPEAIENATQDQAVTIIWAELTALEKLSGEEKPDQEKLKAIGDKLKAIADRIECFLKDSAYDHAKATLTGFAGGLASINWPWLKAQLLLISSTVDEWLAYLILGL